jgi:hypothetical protein
MRQRIETVLDWAAVTGHREGENPARWKGNLQQILPSPNKVRSVQGQPAAPLGEVSDRFNALKSLLVLQS